MARARLEVRPPGAASEVQDRIADGTRIAGIRGGVAGRFAARAAVRRKALGLFA